MSPQDKLAIGMTLFCAVFMVGLMALPSSAFERYYEDLRRRKRSGAMRQLMIGVFVLSGPYFYDYLVGFDNQAMSSLLDIAIGLCAVIVLADIAVFAYKTYGPPSSGGGFAGK
jgi:hypothetical protein